MTQSIPPRPTPNRSHDDFKQLARQANELLKLPRGRSGRRRGGEPSSATSNPRRSRCTTAQLVVARRHGFDSWTKLKQHVDRATVAKLANAAKSGDIARIRAMLKARPELVNMDMAGTTSTSDSLRGAAPTIRSGAHVDGGGRQACKGVYPHRTATTAFTLAKERGYDEIVAIIETEEQHRREAMSCPNATVSPVQGLLNDAIRRGDQAAVIAYVEADPTLVKACDREGGTR